MKHAVIAVLLVFIITLVPVVFIGSGQSPETAEATPPQRAAPPLVNCTDITVGQQVRIRCTAAGVVVLNTTVNLPRVEVTVPGAPVTVRVPLDAETVTETVRVPGPTETVTAPSGNETATETVTLPPEPQATVTVKPNGKPVPTVTVAPDEGRQGDTKDATMEPQPDEDDVVTIPETNLNTPEAVGLGVLSVILIASLILLGMYGGYYMGYKDSDKAEAKFLQSLIGKD